MRKKYIGCKLRIYVAPACEERLARFAEKYHLSMSVAAEILVNANLDSWEKDIEQAQAGNARPVPDPVSANIPGFENGRFILK